MKKDKSFGIIVRKGDKVLMCQRGGIKGWDFPKGHAEPNETILESARREVAEETGYRNVKVDENRLIRIEYVYEKDGEQIQKEVLFFTGEHQGDEIPVTNRDKTDREQQMIIDWVDISEALDKIELPSMRKACLIYKTWMNQYKKN